MLVAGLGCLSLLSHPARASIGPDPNTGPVVSANTDGTYTYTYNIYLTYPDQTTAAPANTFVTFFDIDGLVGGSENTGITNPNFANTTEQALGGNGIGQVVPDDPNFKNVTFQYTGSPQAVNSMFSAPISLGQVSFESTVNRLDLGYFNGQAMNITGPSGYQTRIEMPLGTPEPGTVSAFAFAGIGLAALMLRARKGQVRPTAE